MKATNQLKNIALRFVLLCSVCNITYAGTVESVGKSPGPEYKVVDLGVFRAQAINSHDDVVGGYSLYVHQSRTLVTLGDQASVYGINDRGQIVGSGAPVGQPSQVVLWLKRGGYREVPFNYGLASNGYGISDTGWIAITAEGSSWTEGFVQNLRNPATQSEVPNIAFQNGAFEGGCSCFTTEALAVNENGAVTGDTQFSIKWVPPADPPPYTSHAYLWKNKHLTDLGVLPGLGSTTFSTGRGINNYDDVVGVSTGATPVPHSTDNSYTIVSHAFLYHGGTMRDLGVLGSDLQSQANSINDSGEIVGWSGQIDNIEFPATKAVLYVAGRIYDLNTLIDESSQGQYNYIGLSEAVAINCNGDIAANRMNSDYSYHAYLLVRKGADREVCRKHRDGSP
jgi:probable HAF family extracellular repeat protein